MSEMRNSEVEQIAKTIDDVSTKLVLSSIEMHHGSFRKKVLNELEASTRSSRGGMSYENDTIKFEDDKLIIKITIKTNATCRRSDEYHEATYDADFIVTYSLKPGVSCPEEEIEIFCNVLGPFQCWPFWREFVQSSCARMGLPFLSIPLISQRDFVNNYAKALEAADEE